jgi:hypothetical protein
MRLGQVPAARAYEERRRAVVQRIALAVRLERDGATDGVSQVELSVDDVAPGGCRRVLEVGHVDPRARVQRVNHHLAIDWARDLDAPICELGRCRRASPVARAHVRGLGEEVEA